MSTPSARRSEPVVIAFLAFLGMLMATGIDISLPAFDEIDADLDAGGREALIVTFFLLGTAFGQLIVGPLSDMLGRRPVLLGGLTLYVIGGAAAALAGSYEMLLAARFVWGLGAAAPTGNRTAIARDLYSGDAMARVTTIMMAVFLIGPVFTPLIGQGLLNIADWPVVFWFCAALGILALVATAWFGETLPPERRRPLQVREFGLALRRIARTRVTLGHVIANVFWSAAFFIFLQSSAPVFDRVFDREDDFAFYFAALGLWTIPLLLTNNRLIDRLGARRTSLGTAAISITACALGTILVLVDDTPGFWPWYVWLAFAASFITLTSPPMVALALDPMGDLAGTVSSLLFFTGFAFGSAMAAFVDVFIDDTVTPFVIGFSIYAAIGFAFQVWAGSPEVDPAETDDQAAVPAG
ncbi:MAG: MFS transporter [Actinomycetota bacterium]